jgi:hypothetical protein
VSLADRASGWVSLHVAPAALVKFDALNVDNFVILLSSAGKNLGDFANERR